MRVQHELRQGAVHTCNRSRHNHKAAPGNFTGGFKVEPLCGGCQLKMLFGGEVKLARRAPAVHLHIIVFIGSIRRIVKGQVWNAHEHIGQSLILSFGLFA